MVKINITRGSINDSDDYYTPHERKFELEDTYTLKEYINLLIEKYCPIIKKGDVMWVLLHDVNPIVIFNSNNVEECYFFIDEDIPVSKIFNSSYVELYLSYEFNNDIDQLKEDYRTRKLNMFYHNR